MFFLVLIAIVAWLVFGDGDEVPATTSTTSTSTTATATAIAGTTPDTGGATSSSTSPTVDDYDGGHRCAGGHQSDTVSIEETDGQGAAAVIDAANVIWTCWFYGSHHFLMTVEGDGESLSKADYTSYQVSFIVNNEWPDNVYYDDTGFMVLVQWNHLAKQYSGQVFDSDFSPIKDADIDIEWLDESTLQVIVDLPGDRIEVTEMRTDLYVYISDANDNYVNDQRDVAIWTAQP